MHVDDLSFLPDPRFFAFDVVPVTSSALRVPSTQDASSIINDIFDGLLLAVPKKRRSVEQRLSRKFGVKKWAPHGWKLLDPKTNIITCATCGNYHEIQYLCENCYQQNKAETLVIQENLLKELGYDVNDKEVRILYKGESKVEESDVRFVEIPKKRPNWFTKNLLSKTASESMGPTGDVSIPLETDSGKSQKE